MTDSSNNVQVIQGTAKLTAISALAAFTMAVVLYQFVSIMPLVTDVFAQEAPEQSCNPPGLTQTGTSQNPNCEGGTTPTPNCVSGVEDVNCRNAGTCTPTTGPQSFNRPFFQTPACPN